jgi:hypothetical protein
VQDLSILWKGKKLNEHELDEYLNAYGLILPQSFKNFLLAYNGCSVRKNVFKQRYGVVNILPLKALRGASIELVLDSYDADLNSRHLFPFAIDPTNQVYVVVLVGAKAGQVWLDRGEQKERFEFVASSFEEFVNGLCE